MNPNPFQNGNRNPKPLYWSLLSIWPTLIVMLCWCILFNFCFSSRKNPDHFSSIHRLEMNSHCFPIIVLKFAIYDVFSLTANSYRTQVLKGRFSFFQNIEVLRCLRDFFALLCERMVNFLYDSHVFSPKRKRTSVEKSVLPILIKKVQETEVAWRNLQVSSFVSVCAFAHTDTKS